MEIALNEAKKAYKLKEVPVGAVIEYDGKIIAKAHNLRQTKKVSTYHAEILAIQKACKKLKSWRLENAEIYVTLEPCPMCAGAILSARINKLYFGAYDKTSKTNLLEEIMKDNRLNHKTEVQGGILEQECSSLLSQFFKSKRK